MCLHSHLTHDTLFYIHRLVFICIHLNQCRYLLKKCASVAEHSVVSLMTAHSYCSKPILCFKQTLMLYDASTRGNSSFFLLYHRIDISYLLYQLDISVGNGYTILEGND